MPVLAKRASSSYWWLGLGLGLGSGLRLGLGFQYEPPNPNPNPNLVDLVRAQLHLSARLAALEDVDVRLGVQLAPLRLVLDREALRLRYEGELVACGQGQG